MRPKLNSFVWGSVGTPHHLNHTRPTVKFGSGKITVWGCFRKNVNLLQCPNQSHDLNSIEKSIEKEDNFHDLWKEWVKNHI